MGILLCQHHKQGNRGVSDKQAILTAHIQNKAHIHMIAYLLLLLLHEFHKSGNYSTVFIICYLNHFFLEFIRHLI